MANLTKTFWAAVRARVHTLWEQDGRPQQNVDEHWSRARSEVEREFRCHTAQAGA